MPTQNPAVGEFAPLAHLFHRLSDPRRLRVLFALAEGGGHSVAGLAAAAGTTRFTANCHLNELARLGLVSETRDARRRRFHLHPIVRADDGALNLGRGVRVRIHQLHDGLRYG